MPKMSLDKRIERLERQIIALRIQRMRARAYAVAETLRPMYPQFANVDVDDFLSLIMLPLEQPLEKVAMRMVDLVSASTVLQTDDEGDLAAIIQARKRGWI